MSTILKFSLPKSHLLFQLAAVNGSKIALNLILLKIAPDLDP